MTAKLFLGKQTAIIFTTLKILTPPTPYLLLRFDEESAILSKVFTLAKAGSFQ